MASYIYVHGKKKLLSDGVVDGTQAVLVDSSYWFDQNHSSIGSLEPYIVSPTIPFTAVDISSESASSDFANERVELYTTSSSISFLSGSTAPFDGRTVASLLLFNVTTPYILLEFPSPFRANGQQIDIFFPQSSFLPAGYYTLGYI